MISKLQTRRKKGVQYARAEDESSGEGNGSQTYTQAGKRSASSRIRNRLEFSGRKKGTWLRLCSEMGARPYRAFSAGPGKNER